MLPAQSYRGAVRYIPPGIHNESSIKAFGHFYSVAAVILDAWRRDISVSPDDLLQELSTTQPLLSFVLEECLINQRSLRLARLSGKSKHLRARSAQLASAVKLACSDRAQSRKPDHSMSLLAALLGIPWSILNRTLLKIEWNLRWIGASTEVSTSLKIFHLLRWHQHSPQLLQFSVSQFHKIMVSSLN